MFLFFFLKFALKIWCRIQPCGMIWEMTKWQIVKKKRCISVCKLSVSWMQNFEKNKFRLYLPCLKDFPYLRIWKWLGLTCCIQWLKRNFSIVIAHLYSCTTHESSTYCPAKKSPVWNILWAKSWCSLELVKNILKCRSNKIICRIDDYIHK